MKREGKLAVVLLVFIFLINHSFTPRTLIIVVAGSSSSPDPEKDYVVINATVAEGFQRYEEWNSTFGENIAADKLVEWFNNQSEVGSSGRNGMDVWLHFRTGEPFIVSLRSLPSTNSATPDPSSYPAVSPASRGAVIMDSFQWQFADSLLIEGVSDDLVSMGYTVAYYKDQQVTVDLLASLDDQQYGVVYLRTHGGLFLNPKHSAAEVYFCTGEVVNSNNWIIHFPDINESRVLPVMTSRDKWFYAVSPSFFSFYCENPYPDSLFLAEACSSAKNPTMGNELLALGVHSYLGWTETVQVCHGDWASYTFFANWCSPRNVSEAMAEIEPDPCTGAQLIHYGEADLYPTSPIRGDVDSNGLVDIDDMIIWANAFGSQPQDSNWNWKADVVADNVVDIFDAIIISLDFGRTYQ